jgi:hypothetical protein
MPKQLDLGALARWLYALSSEDIRTELEFYGSKLTVGLRDRRPPQYHARWDVSLEGDVRVVEGRLKQIRGYMTREIARRS